MSGLPPPGETVAVVLDDSALLALGSGHQLVSRLIVGAHGGAGRYVFAPAMCLAAAAGDRPQLADHVGALRAISMVDLGFAGAAAVGALIAGGAGWRYAHAVVAARPSAEWPAGLPVVTATPDAYTAHGVRTIALS